MGAFPPPEGGAARINQTLYEWLLARGVNAAKIDLSAATLAHQRGLKYHLTRLERNIVGLVQGLRMVGPETTLHVVPDGGAGAWYTVIHVRLVARLCDRLIIHHQTCKYINEWMRAMMLISQSHRPKVTHVFLSTGMAEKFQLQYGRVTNQVALIRDSPLMRLISLESHVPQGQFGSGTSVIFAVRRASIP